MCREEPFVVGLCRHAGDDRIAGRPILGDSICTPEEIGEQSLLRRGHPQMTVSDEWDLFLGASHHRQAIGKKARLLVEFHEIVVVLEHPLGWLFVE